MFEKGETVVYGALGICVIEDIREESFGDLKGEVKKYYILRPLKESSSTLFVPVDNKNLTDKIKRVLTENELELLLEEVRSCENDWIDNERERSAKCGEIVKSGDRVNILGMIKSFHDKKSELNENGKKLRMADDKLLNAAKKVVEEEFSYITGVDKDDISEYIMNRMKDC